MCFRTKILRTALLVLAALWTISGHAASIAPASEFNLADYKGKVLYLDFWASWCGPCRQSFPWMNEMQKKYGRQGLRVVAVSVDTEEQAAKRFLERYPAEFEVLLDISGKLAEQYDLPGMPSSFLFGRDGKRLSRHLGFRAKSKPKLEAEIRQALAKQRAKVKALLEQKTKRLSAPKPS